MVLVLKAEYGRKGLDWELFNENSKKFNKYISSYSIVSSIYSITSIPELLLWVKENNKTFLLQMEFILNILTLHYLISLQRKKLLEHIKTLCLNNIKLSYKFEIQYIRYVKHMNSSNDTVCYKVS